jgi:integrase
MRQQDKRSSATLERTKHPGIYKRGNRYVVVYRDPQGRQRKRFAKTMAEARDLKATLRADVARGEYRQLSRTSFAEYAAEWIASYAGRTSRGLRENTRADYRRQLGLDDDGEPIGDGAVAYFGRMRLAEIEPRDVKRYAATVAARGVSANTVRLALAPVKALLATAVEDGLIRSNPAAGLRIAVPARPVVDESEERVKALTEDELRALIAATPDEWRLLVTFLAVTGLRASEALALRWSDLDLGRGRVKVRRSLVRGTFGEPKTKHARRDVPLSESIARSLWNARKASGAQDDAPIFGGADGQPLDRWTVFRVVRAAGKRASVPWVGLHTLRHSAATMLFRSGWNAVQVQKFLGHHSPAFTLATYVHLLPDDLPTPTFVDEIADVSLGGAARCDSERAGDLREDPIGNSRVVERRPHPDGSADTVLERVGDLDRAALRV